MSSVLNQPGVQRIGGFLSVSRCPHCSIANPQCPAYHRSGEPVPAGPGYNRRFWAIYSCTTCGSLITAEAEGNQGVNNPVIGKIYPDARGAHEDIPEMARRFLNQAFETLGAPDAAAVMAGSAVDAMLKDLGLVEGSLYNRIDQALADNIITQGMADWAHSVRLGSNRPRHADANNPHVSAEEARQSVEFAEALGQFLFVLTARIQRGIDAAAEQTGG